MIHISVLGSNTEAWRGMALRFLEFILLMTGPGRQVENGKASSPPYPPLPGTRKPEGGLFGVCSSSAAERAF